jgi:hypothetical protein
MLKIPSLYTTHRTTNVKVYESKEIKGPKQVVQDRLMLPRCLLVKGDKSYF